MLRSAVYAFAAVAVLMSSAQSTDAREASPFSLGVPANHTCAVLWDEDDGAFSRDKLVLDGRVVLRIPDSDDARELLPELAGRSVELDLDSLHDLPPGMTAGDTIVLGTRTDGRAAFAPYSLFAEIKACLPCPDLAPV